jgi:hypothetical protein
MSTPTLRARHRDNAAKLGKFQLAMTEGFRMVNAWMDTTSGQLTLIGIVGAALLLAMTIKP